MQFPHNKLRIIKIFILKNKIPLIASGSIASATAIGGGTYAIIDKEPTKEKKQSTKEEITSLDSDTAFAKIDSGQFYDAVYIKNGKAAIDKNIISAIIKDQLTRTSVILADFEYEYALINSSHINLKLSFIDSSKNKISKYFDIFLEDL